ncbi:MAG: tetratricopeptide repeat protein [Saprospiraceae bacterium]|nr:tetratricopeptide repeat protein [Saprospiraceae bacterium]
MKFKNIPAVLVALSLFMPAILLAQNTLDGQAKTVPEAEVTRQSAFVNAERERLLGHHDKAIELYKKFTYDNPDVGAAWYGMARSYFAKDDMANALESVVKAVEKEPANEWYQIFQADILEKTGRAKDAVKVYEGLTKRFPNTVEFWQHLAYLSVLAADPKGGLKALERVESLRGITLETTMEKHLIYVGMGDSKKAAAELQKLADIYPERIEYRHRLAKYYETSGDKASARKVYEDILRRRPDDPEAKLAVLDKAKSSSDADYLASLKPLFADAKISIDAKIKEVLPYIPKLEAGRDESLTQTLLELGSLVEQAHPTDPKAWSLSGDLRYHANRPAEALERYRKCIELNPTVFSVWENTLDILYQQQRHDEMLRMADQAIDAFPNQPKAYYYYGLAANEKGQHDDARAQLEQAVLMTGNNFALRLDIQDQIGLALLGKKDFAAAVSHYERLLTQGGDKHPGIMEHFGDALFQKGERSAAVEVWKKANAIRKSAELERKIGERKL